MSTKLCTSKIYLFVNDFNGFDRNILPCTQPSVIFMEILQVCNQLKIFPNDRNKYIIAVNVRHTEDLEPLKT